MTQNVAAIIGSGTTPFTRGILPASQRGAQAAGEGVRVGQQVMVANPEDLNSVDAFAVSGVSFGVTPVLIWSYNINPLPRQRTIILENIGPNDAFIGPNSTSVIAPSGFQIYGPAAAANESLSRIELPFLRNVEIWARSTGTSQIRILAY